MNSTVALVNADRRRFWVLPLVMLCVTTVAGAQTAVSLTQAGEIELRAGRFADAGGVFIEALRLNPADSRAAAGAARAFFGLMEYDEALRYVRIARTNAGTGTGIAALEARILAAMGDISAAGAAFERILAREPNNIDARLGLAELSLAGGNLEEANRRYHEAAAIAPRDHRVLLALGAVYYDQGDVDGARRYYEAAVRYHGDNPLVHAAAGRFFRSVGDNDRARFHAETFAVLDNQSVESARLLGEVLLAAGDYEQSAAVYARITQIAPGSAQDWYARGVIAHRLNDHAAAGTFSRRALRLDPNNELIRLFAESVVAHFDLDDPFRRELAGWHQAQAEAAAARYQPSKVRYHVTQGLALDPYSWELRLMFAETFRIAGMPNRYLSELVIALETLIERTTAESADADLDIGATTRTIETLIETYTYRQQQDLAVRAAVDQFAIARDRYTMALYYVVESAAALPIGAAAVLGALVQQLLGRQEFLAFSRESFEPEIAPAPYPGAQEAFADARRQAVDYYAVVRFAENRDVFAVDLVVHLARTGQRVATFAQRSSGMQRYQDAVSALAARVGSALQPRGVLLQRTGSTGLVTLGTADGLNVNDELVIVPTGALELSVESLGLAVPEQAVIGRAVVEEAGELLSRVSLVSVEFFDRIAPGDTVLRSVDRDSPTGGSD